MGSLIDLTDSKEHINVYSIRRREKANYDQGLDRDIQKNSFIQNISIEAGRATL
jgi:hypothetical protein